MFQQKEQVGRYEAVGVWRAIAVSLLFCLPLCVSVVFSQPSGAPATAPSDTVGSRAVSTDQSSTPAYDMGAEVVKVLQRMKIEEPKPRFFPPVDPYDPINIALRTDKYVYDDKLYDIMDSSGAPRLLLLSGFVRVPAINRFMGGVMAINSPEFEDNVTDWDMVVSNSRGETVRRITGGGNPPLIIRWDGLDDRGSMVVTGETYNFTFYATDVSGKQLRIPGRPQRISGLLYDDNTAGGWVVTVASDEVFQYGSTLLTEDAVSWLDGVGNAINERMKSDISVYLYGDKDNLVKEQAQIVVSELKRRVVLSAEGLRVTPRYLPGLDARLARIEVRIN